MNRSLEGVRVLDFSRYAPGLFATTLLGDLGAEVISVEPPRHDDTDPPLYPSAAARRSGCHPLFRHRRSIEVDTRSAEGLRIAHALMARTDVVVEGFRPGVADTIGIGFARARELNPSIVYCSITGYGQTGEQARRPGHDLNYIAESGLLSHMAVNGAVPGIPSNIVADMAGGGLTAALAVVAALFARRTGSPAQYLDISMVRSVMAMMAPLAAMQLVGAPDPSWGAGLLNGAAPFYRTYRTRDGAYVSVAAIEPKFFAELCRVLGREDLVERQFDHSSWPQTHADFERVFLGRDRDQWAALLVDAAVTPVYTTTEAFARATPTPVPPAPVATRLFSEGYDEIEPYCHRRGQDTQAILAELRADDSSREAVREPD